MLPSLRFWFSRRAAIAPRGAVFERNDGPAERSSVTDRLDGLRAGLLDFRGSPLRRVPAVGNHRRIAGRDAESFSSLDVQIANRLGYLHSDADALIVGQRHQPRDAPAPWPADHR